MVGVQTLSIAIASAGLFTAAIYYILDLRHWSKVRQAEWGLECGTGKPVGFWARRGSSSFLGVYR